LHEQIDKEPRMMTTGEVAKYLRVSRATVYRLVKQAKIPVSRISKHLRFRRDVIDRWLSEQEASNSHAKNK
jgi:excisionase family DNA binding protein